MAANTNPPGTAAFRFDVVAGLTAAAVVLPKAMAYATVAGLPVAVGLYTAFIPMAVYALLGSSRVLSVSSTATLGILTATQLGLVVPDGDAGEACRGDRHAGRAGRRDASRGEAPEAGVRGELHLHAGADRLQGGGRPRDRAGPGCPSSFGVHITKHGFFADVLSLAQHVPETSMITLAVAVATFVVLIAMERLWPHSPAPLVVVGGSIAASWFFGLHARGSRRSA